MIIYVTMVVVIVFIFVNVLITDFKINIIFNIIMFLSVLLLFVLLYLFVFFFCVHFLRFCFSLYFRLLPPFRVMLPEDSSESCRPRVKLRKIIRLKSPFDFEFRRDVFRTQIFKHPPRLSNARRLLSIHPTFSSPIRGLPWCIHGTRLPRNFLAYFTDEKELRF